VPSLVYANAAGEISDFPELLMAGRSGADFVTPSRDEIIPLPEGSELFVLPNRLPVGIDPADNQPARLQENPIEPTDGIQAVAAFIAPAHTATLLAAYEKDASQPPPLPLFAYTAVGWLDGRFWVCAFRSDSSARQDIAAFPPREVAARTSRGLNRFKHNRLVQHLGKCSLTYGCPAAKNFFLGREEAPLPTSPACNARCAGCISLQPSGCCPSTQERIRFVPTPAEIAEVAVTHLSRVEYAVASFGQGCEGEPLLQADVIGKAISKIRARTDRGTINLNSNASRPQAVAALADAGLDSIRVSMNSARPEIHQRYYRPKDFTFADVRASALAMKKRGKFVSLNYFVFPGVTDDEAEYEALCDFIDAVGVDFVQLRNMNMDPDWYLESIGPGAAGAAMGIPAWLAALERRFPALGYGYFNPPLRP